MWVAKTFPYFLSKNLSSDVLLITISVLLPFSSLVLTVFKSSIWTIQSDFATILASTSDLDAFPPTWNVLSVNWVPGSPIDCAATIPTGSPIWANLAEPKLTP